MSGPLSRNERAELECLRIQNKAYSFLVKSMDEARAIVGRDKMADLDARIQLESERAMNAELTMEVIRLEAALAELASKARALCLAAEDTYDERSYPGKPIPERLAMEEALARLMPTHPAR